MVDWDLPQDQFESQNKQNANYYDVLEVPFDASRLQIREAYIRLRSTFAAGSQVLYSLVSEDEARKSIEALEEAYRVLDDELLRRDYDLQLFPQAAALTPDGPLRNGSGVSQQLGRTRLHSHGNKEPKTRHIGIDDLWTGQSRSESRGGATSQVAGESAKTKRFSLNAFDDSTRARVEAYIEQASACDGQFFVGLREMLSVTQNEIQDKTKISLQYIKAIESDDFRCLPSLVYVKGFLKCYLQYLGLEREANRIIDAYTETYRNWRSK